MTEWKLTVSPEFGDDLRNIHSYISNVLLEPSAAKNTVDRILKAVKELTFFPLRYPVYEKEPWSTRKLRKMSIGNYLVFYFADEAVGAVLVLRVFYAGRNLEKCLEETI